MIVRRGALLVTVLALAVTGCTSTPEPATKATGTGNSATGGSAGGTDDTAATASDKCQTGGSVTAAGAGGTVAGSATVARIQTSGKVVVGIKYDQPNLGYRDVDNNRCGFDIQIAQLIAARLGAQPSGLTFKEIPSVNREIAIKASEIDYYVGTYSITDNRKKDVSFAGPYFVAGQDLLVRRSDTTITGKDTLRGKKVCSATNSTAIQRVRDMDLTEGENVVEFKTYSECVTQLLDRRVDAVTTDDAILKGFAAQNPRRLKVVGSPFSTEKYGIGLARDDKALRNRINDILQTAVTDGTWQKIYDATLGRSGTSAKPPALERY